MAQDNLKQKTKNGLYWSFANNIANKGMQFVFSIILARLLTPSDYGLIGMLAIFIAIIQIFVESGFSQAIITKQDRTQTDLSTAFYFNIGVGVLGYLILFLSAPLIANFYGMPMLKPILRVIGLGVIFNSLNIVQNAHYAIRLDFKTPAKVSVFSQMFTGVLGIFLAYEGFGVWALVIQQVSGGLIGLLLNWYLVRWKPTAEFNKESFLYLWSYGSKVLSSGLLTTIYDNVQPLLIGKFFSSSALGLYSRAQGFATLPSSNLSGILANVTFPLLSKINDDIERLGSIYRRLIKFSAFIIFPLMIGLAAISAPLVHFLLPERWNGCIPLLRLLCFSLMWQPISLVNLNLLNAAKRPDVVLKLEMIKKPLGLILLIASIPYGIIMMCVANLLVCLLAVAINTVMTSRTLNVPFMAQVRDLLPVFLLSLSMGCIVYFFTTIVHPPLLSMIIGIAIGFVVYILGAYFFMPELMKDTLYLIKRKK